MLAVALIVTACGGGSSPTSPSTSVPPASSPPPPSSSPDTTRWTVSHRFVSVEGPDNCWVRQQRAKLTGVAFGNMAMSITRSNGSIAVESEWFQTYRGTYSGSEFETSGTRPICKKKMKLRLLMSSWRPGRAHGLEPFNDAAVDVRRLWRAAVFRVTDQVAAKKAVTCACDWPSVPL
jgi:hypothetical protein